MCAEISKVCLHGKSLNPYPTLYGLFISGYEDLGGGVFDESKTAKEA